VIPAILGTVVGIPVISATSDSAPGDVPQIRPFIRAIVIFAKPPRHGATGASGGIESHQCHERHGGSGDHLYEERRIDRVVVGARIIAENRLPIMMAARLRFDLLSGTIESLPPAVSSYEGRLTVRRSRLRIVRKPALSCAFICCSVDLRKKKKT
jgi:hypothetical protein